MRSFLFTCLVLLTSLGQALAKAERPNVLFIAVDDMKDWVNCLGGYEGRVHTPNIDRLAKRGMLFTNAHCVSPKCAPSRAAIMTGLRPSTTGLYDNQPGNVEFSADGHHANEVSSKRILGRRCRKIFTTRRAIIRRNGTN